MRILCLERVITEIISLTDNESNADIITSIMHFPLIASWYLKILRKFSRVFTLAIAIRKEQTVLSVRQCMFS